jgi:phosphoglycerate dehydrogenase-like enzyme
MIRPTLRLTRLFGSIGHRRCGGRIGTCDGVSERCLARAILNDALTDHICSVGREIAIINARIKAGQYLTQKFGLTGLTLTGTTLLVIGGGNIGLTVGRMFYGAFGCSILVFDPYISARAKAAWESTIPSANLKWIQDLDTEGYPVADVISLHIPLLPSTKDMIGKAQFAKMKATAIIVNTARGGIINEDDLVDALDQGLIHGAGLDATAVEPPTVDSNPRLVKHERCIVT